MSNYADIIINGQRRALGDGEGSESLLRWLKRHQSHGTKEGCADGDCGACTVAMRLLDADGQPQWQAVNACLLPVGALVGREFVTVEGLAQGERLHPVQQAMVEEAGSQCGYCTPGFVMSLFAAHSSNQLDDACFEGNLCRCTGYLPIRRALAQLKSTPAESPVPAFDAASELPAEMPGWRVATSLDDALRAKRDDPAAAWIAGGTDLGVALSHGRGSHQRYIALDRIAELQQIDVGEIAVRVGAGVSLRSIEQRIGGLFPAIDQMLPWFAARQVRNRATLGGNLGTASPIGDLLPALLAMDAIVHCRSADGARDLPVDAFFLDYRKTALRLDELIEAVTIPRRDDWTIDAYKVAKRQADDISIVAAVFAIQRDADGNVCQARLAFGGVAAMPMRAKAAEAALLGKPLDASQVEPVAKILRETFTPLSDLRASADYRRALCGNLFAKFVRAHGDAVEASA